MMMQKTCYMISRSMKWRRPGRFRKMYVTSLHTAVKNNQSSNIIVGPNLFSFRASAPSTPKLCSLCADVSQVLHRRLASRASRVPDRPLSSLAGWPSGSQRPATSTPTPHFWHCRSSQQLGEQLSSTKRHEQSARPPVLVPAWSSAPAPACLHVPVAWRNMPAVK